MQKTIIIDIPFPGQRWISEMEPEFGLGIVTGVDQRMVMISFPAVDQQRQYAVKSAPLRRVRFNPGDTVQPRNGAPFKVESVLETDGMISYSGAGRVVHERDLSDKLSFSTPRERLRLGITDDSRNFELRYRTLQNDCRIRTAVERGLVGGRITLIPHQLHVAYEVCKRSRPRVLLCDEVGLGKTIEASLILHRLLVTGRIARVLILVPEPLVNQWFVELLRKFNLVFRIADGEYLDTGAAPASSENPFLSGQLFLGAIETLAGNQAHRTFAVNGAWDMVIVDEAHHLTQESAGYSFVKELGSVAPGLLLITATPDQLGLRSLFAMLRLLDPDRYHDFALFEAESAGYAAVARIAGSLIDGSTLDDGERALLNQYLPGVTVDDLPSTRQGIVKQLIDRHGIGRSLFRNVRSSMGTPSSREVHLCPLDGDKKIMAAATEEFRADTIAGSAPAAHSLRSDPRILWLAALLRSIPEEKVLLICRTVQKAIAVEEALRREITIDTGLFHEQLNLMQRDRNAAWFSRDDGARLMICSEIGSEGRNFQFASHLVLFDLPCDPELLEQRIGRIDRIGQRRTVHVHVPYIRSTPQEVMARWYHEGLGAFESNVPGAYEVFLEQGALVKEAALSLCGVDTMLAVTRECLIRVSAQLHDGRDRLLELHSMDHEQAVMLVERIHGADTDGMLRSFAADLFAHFGVIIEDGQGKTVLVNFTTVDDPAFPLPPLRENDVGATFDRTAASSREEIEFLTWEHPMVAGAMQLVLGSQRGNSAAAIMPGAAGPGALLEAIFVCECVAPGYLQADRFLPPTPVRVVIDQSGTDVTGQFQPALIRATAHGTPPPAFFKNPKVAALIDRLTDIAEKMAQKRVLEITDDALRSMNPSLGREIDRLAALAKVNPGISKSEIDTLANERNELEKAIGSARLRLDSLRLIIRTK